VVLRQDAPASTVLPGVGLGLLEDFGVLAEVVPLLPQPARTDTAAAAASQATARAAGILLELRCGRDDPVDPALDQLSHLTFANYRTLLSGQDDIVRNVTNSLIVAVPAAALTAVVSTMAGYGFGLFRFRGSGLVFGLVLLAFMIPLQRYYVRGLVSGALKG
jgi:ABC-type glycerol-3-phosphate transport system permease component